ncbi:MAG: iron-sulfur cluster repair di-iron protein [Bryobacteraceae bacterium]|jgi:regulator of cell morphogenesis and NO signaling
MSTLSPVITVGELAARMPRSAQVFEQFGIDYCCGGGQAFDQVCRARGLDPAAVLAEIERQADPAAGAASQSDWQSTPLTLLIDHIVGTHHAYMKTELPRLDGKLEKILAKHSARHGAVLLPLAETFRAMKEELEGHLLKEEMILFPLIRSLDEGGPAAREFHCGSVQNPIRVMVAEHDSAGQALGGMRQLTAGYTPPEDACNTFRAFYCGLEEMERDLHQHIHLENNILFPRAVDLESRQ